jgi:hypothetical protein
VYRAPTLPRPDGAGAPAQEPPALCVDLDGTLLATDSLHELLLALARERPLELVRLPLWLRGGRAVLKARLGARVRLDPALLPYRPAVLDALREARAQGRRCVLVTAADAGLARGVAEHVGLFDEVLGSDGRENLKGRRKAQRPPGLMASDTPEGVVTSEPIGPRSARFFALPVVRPGGVVEAR